MALATQVKANHPVLLPGCHWTGGRGQASLSAEGDGEVNSAAGHESGTRVYGTKNGAGPSRSEEVLEHGEQEGGGRKAHRRLAEWTGRAFGLLASEAGCAEWLIYG